MANVFPNPDTQFQPGQSGNPKGPKPGYKHLSTWIQELLNDEEFETLLNDPRKGYIEYKGAPLKAIIQVAIRKALAGDDRAMEWLAKHGYGTREIIEINDPRLGILDKYMGGIDKDAGQTKDTEGRPPTDPA